VSGAGGTGDRREGRSLAQARGGRGKMHHTEQVIGREVAAWPWMAAQGRKGARGEAGREPRWLIPCRKE
jgi:hypothetical protein